MESTGVSPVNSSSTGPRLEHTIQARIRLEGLLNKLWDETLYGGHLMWTQNVLLHNSSQRNSLPSAPANNIL